MSLIIDAIKKAQQLRLKDLKEPPFFKGPRRRERSRTQQRRLWTLGAFGFALLLIVLGSFSYSRWKSHEGQTIASAVSTPAQVATKDDSQGHPKEEASVPRTEWPSLWEKYETDETWGDVFKRPKAKKRKIKKATVVSIGNESDRIQHPVAPQGEPLMKASELERQASVDRKKTPSTLLPEQPPQETAPASPKQEAIVQPKKTEIEIIKNQTAVSDALIHFNSGVSLYHQREYAKAIGAYQKVIELDSAYAEAHNNLGIIYQELGDFDRALFAYQKAIEINPKYEKAFNNLGVLLYLKGRDEESIQAFQKALAINPNNVESHVNLGILLKKQGQMEQALESYRRALAIDPLHGEAHYNTGLLYEQLGDIEMAIDHYQQFIQVASKTHPDLVSKVKRHLNYLVTVNQEKK